MKTLTLNYSKWRCGGPEDNDVSLGKGETALLNEQGYMCCLGQFSLQLNKELKEINIKNHGNPEDATLNQLSVKIPLLTKKSKYNIINVFRNTQFSNKATDINDNEETTPAVKISKLRSLLKKYKYKLKVINKK